MSLSTPNKGSAPQGCASPSRVLTKRTPHRSTPMVAASDSPKRAKAPVVMYDADAVKGEDQGGEGIIGASNLFVVYVFIVHTLFLTNLFVYSCYSYASVEHKRKYRTTNLEGFAPVQVGNANHSRWKTSARESHGPNLFHI